MTNVAVLLAPQEDLNKEHIHHGMDILLENTVISERRPDSNTPSLAETCSDLFSHPIHVNEMTLPSSLKQH